MITTIINVIGIVIVTVLLLMGALNLYLIVRSWFTPQVDPSRLQYARLRLEWESNCVTYKVVPYYNEKTLEISTMLAAAISMREETDGEGKRYVQDKVKAVTVVHKQWPSPKATDAGEA